MSMDYQAILNIVIDDTEGLTCDNPEYIRGQLDLVSELFARPGIERGMRIEEIEQDIRELIRIQS
jgi:hypothetical protein